ncbi:DNA repair protein RecO [uncultured Flavonifractor sp.]|uniref:DNA repair protein RecO n=1 Tax=uncultured Flavonifractor sp. TaxID=1193534 RepID=UPI00262925CB|nr:DNA repair protein RecO [uncultured Flavonifractor sp.]
MHIATQGLVLREVNYKESDKILTVLTAEGGKRTVKARGCRRKNSPLAASAQLLVYSDMTLFLYQDRITLNEAESIRQFWHVKSDVELLALASYFAEVMEVVSVEGRPDPAAMSLILNSLHALDKLNKPQALVKGAYEMKLMALEGYEPLADACAVCGRPDPEKPMLHLSEGVLHCAACKSEVGEGTSLPLTEGALAALRHILYGDPKRLFSFQLDQAGLDCLAKVCEGFLRTQLDRGFRTLDFYHELKAGM